MSFWSTLYTNLVKAPRRKKALKDLLSYNRTNPGRYTCVFLCGYSEDIRKWYRVHLFKYFKERSKGHPFSATPFATLAVLYSTSQRVERERFLFFMKRLYNV
jgi:hypothetical protein